MTCRHTSLGLWSEKCPKCGKPRKECLEDQCREIVHSIFERHLEPIEKEN